MAAEKDNVDVQKLERKISEIEKILEESKPKGKPFDMNEIFDILGWD